MQSPPAGLVPPLYAAHSPPSTLEDDVGGSLPMMPSSRTGSADSVSVDQAGTSQPLPRPSPSRPRPTPSTSSPPPPPSSSLPSPPPLAQILSLASAQTFQVFVRGVDNKTFALDASANDSTESLKNKIALKQGVPAAMQWLTYAGKVLQSARTMASYGIVKGCTLHLSLRVKGGADTSATASIGSTSSAMPSTDSVSHNVSPSGSSNKRKDSTASPAASPSKKAKEQHVAMAPCDQTLLRHLDCGEVVVKAETRFRAIKPGSNRSKDVKDVVKTFLEAVDELLPLLLSYNLPCEHTTSYLRLDHSMDMATQLLLDESVRACADICTASAEMWYEEKGLRIHVAGPDAAARLLLAVLRTLLRLIQRSTAHDTKWIDDAETGEEIARLEPLLEATQDVRERAHALAALDAVDDLVEYNKELRLGFFGNPRLTATQKREYQAARRASHYALAEVRLQTVKAGLAYANTVKVGRQRQKSRPKFPPSESSGVPEQSDAPAPAPKRRRAPTASTSTSPKRRRASTASTSTSGATASSPVAQISPQPVLAQADTFVSPGHAPSSSDHSSTRSTASSSSASRAGRQQSAAGDEHSSAVDRMTASETPRTVDAVEPTAAADARGPAPSTGLEDPNEREVAQRWRGQPIIEALGDGSTETSTPPILTTTVEIRGGATPPRVLYLLKAGDASSPASTSSVPTYGSSQVGEDLFRSLPAFIRQEPGHNGLTFIHAFTSILARSYSFVLDLFVAADPYLVQILSSDVMLDWATRSSVSGLLRCSSSIAAKVMLAVKEANRRIEAHLARLDHPHADRPRLVVQQYRSSGFSLRHSKMLLTVLEDGSIAVVIGSGNVSRAGFGGEGTDLDGNVPSSASYETGEITIMPRDSVLAGELLAGFDGAEAHLFNAGRVLETSSASTAPIASVRQVQVASAEVERIEKLVGVEAAKASRRLLSLKLDCQSLRDKTYVQPITTDQLARLNSSASTLPKSDALVIKLGEKPAKPRPISEAIFQPTAGEQQRGIELCASPTGKGVVVESGGSGTWHKGIKGKRVSGVLICASCGRTARGTLPVDIYESRSWEVRHLGHVKTCSKILWSSSSAFYPNEMLADEDDDEAGDKQATLETLLDLLLAYATHDPETDVRVLDPLYAWYKSLTEPIHGYAEVATSIVDFFRASIDRQHPLYDHYVDRCVKFLAKPDRKELSQQLVSRLAPATASGRADKHSLSECTIFPNRLSDIINHRWPLLDSVDD